jgi:GAF domain-containing protein
MRSLIAWVNARSVPTRAAMSALLTGFLFYLAALAEGHVEIAIQTLGFGARAAQAAVVILAAALWWFVATLYREETERLGEQQRQRVRALAYAATLMSDFVAWQTTSLRSQWATGDTATKALIRVASSVDSLHAVVKATYSLLASQYGEDRDPLGRIHFEATFMTRSYRDSELTVAAYENEDHRMPTSMRERSTNPKIYSTTETAKLYAERSSRLRIVEDTVSLNANYAELYPGQRQRIRSSLICPVFSDQSELLGTLVAHCDRPGFFSEADRSYWSEVLAVFAKRLALEKERLDLLWASEAARRDLGLAEPPF